MNLVDHAQKNIYVVLGMSRSGTSAIARALQTLNIHLGDNFLPGDSRNPKGFYEDTEILYTINRGVSGLLDDPWFSLGLLDEAKIDKHADLATYKQYAMRVLHERLATSSTYGFKDPRTVMILPFWQAVFKSMPVTDHYIITVRNPLATAYSNQTFANIDIEIGLILWLTIMFAAIEGTQHKSRVIVSYECLLENPTLQLTRMQTALGLTEPLRADEVANYAHDFIDKKLSHHQQSEIDMHNHAAMAVVPLCAQVYQLILRVARDEVSLTSLEFQQAWVEIRAEFNRLYPIYHYISRLEKQTKVLERSLRTVRKSWPWKLLYPLRLIDDVLRARRRKDRLRKRVAPVYGN